MSTYALMQELRARLRAPTRRPRVGAGRRASDEQLAQPLLPRAERASSEPLPPDWPRLPDEARPADPGLLERLRQATIARIGVGRAGVRLRTATFLEFLGGRAVAVEAVRSELPEDFASRIGAAAEVHTKANDLDEFLLRPDLGRLLPETELSRIEAACTHGPDVQVVVGDGLSARAVEMNAPPFLASFTEECRRLGLSLGSTVLVRRARVKVMDQIGAALRAKQAIHLIGERPGLGTGDGMSAYLIHGPRNEAMDSDREVVSNIHARGVVPSEAGRLVAGMLVEFMRAGISGVKRQAGEVAPQTSAAARYAG